MAKLVDRAALEEFRQKLQSKRRKGKKKLISLCAGSGCGAYGTAKVHQALVDELKRQKLEKKVEVKLTGCHGFCEKGPIMVIHPEGIFYPQVKEKHIPEIVKETLKKGEEFIGNRVRAKIVKNKVAAPFRQAEFEIHFAEGISRSADVLDMAVAHNIVEKSGTWFSFENEKIGQGKENTRRFLNENPKILAKMEKMVIAAAKAKDK